MRIYNEVESTCGKYWLGAYRKILGMRENEETDPCILYICDKKKFCYTTMEIEYSATKNKKIMLDVIKRAMKDLSEYKNEKNS